MSGRIFLLSDDIVLILNNEEFWIKQNESVNQKIFEMLGKIEFQLQELSDKAKAKLYIFDKEKKEYQFLRKGIESIINFHILQILDIEIVLNLNIVGGNEFVYSINLHLRHKDRFPILKML